MTLKEQFIKLTKKFSPNLGWVDDVEDAEKCEKIADEYAADFAAWCIEAVLNEEEPKGSSMNELQIAYKKEKGL